MPPEENTDIENNTIVGESTSQEQVLQSQYGYGIPEGSDGSNSDYSGGGSGIHQSAREGMNGFESEVVDEELSTTPAAIRGGPASSISGNDRDQYEEAVLGDTPEAPTWRRRDRGSEYEEYCRRNSLVGGRSKGRGKGGEIGLGLRGGAELVEFRVKRKIWGEEVGSPITRLPNGEYFQASVLWWC